MNAHFGPDALSAVSFLWSCAIVLAQEGFVDDCELGG